MLNQYNAAQHPLPDEESWKPPPLCTACYHGVSAVTQPRVVLPERFWPATQRSSTMDAATGNYTYMSIVGNDGTPTISDEGTCIAWNYAVVALADDPRKRQSLEDTRVYRTRDILRGSVYTVGVPLISTSLIEWQTKALDEQLGLKTAGAAVSAAPSASTGAVPTAPVVSTAHRDVVEVRQSASP